MAATEIPQRPPPLDYLVKVSVRMCPAVMGWRKGELLRGSNNSLGIKIPIGGVLIIIEIIFMM